MTVRADDGFVWRMIALRMMDSKSDLRGSNTHDPTPFGALAILFPTTSGEAKPFAIDLCVGKRRVKNEKNDFFFGFFTVKTVKILC